MGVLRGRLAPGIHWALTTRQGVQSGGDWRGFNVADHCGDSAASVAANRRWLAQVLAVDDIAWLRQVHGSRCVTLDGAGADLPDVSDVPEADASCTGRRGLALAIMVADCLPILLADRDGCWVGAAHAGWRGLAGGVVESLLAAAPVPGRHLVAWLGPRICPDHYEVDDPVRAALADDGDAFTDTRPGHYGLDLGAVARRRLAAGGVANIVDTGHCAFAHPKFYSFRRSPVTGRNAALVWLV